MAYDLFNKYGVENCNIVLIESVNASSNDELKMREAHYIKTLDCFNKNIPMRTQKEWYGDNKETIKKQTKVYQKANKEKIKEYIEANKDKIKEYMKHHNKPYYQTKKEKLKATQATN
jgi:hypothetical protein